MEMLFRIEDDIETILDVGPGAGQWYDLLHDWFPSAAFDCIEIFEPYVERYGLRKKYRHVIVGDARERSMGRYDLVIFGDVIEHMMKSDAVAMVDRLLSKHALISIPIGPCPQDGTEENPHEEHLAEWSTAEVLESFPVVDPYFAHQYPPPHYGRGVFRLEKRP
jgi:hypothetical protein